MSTAIDAIIMGQSYKLACKEGEELALKQADCIHAYRVRCCFSSPRKIVLIFKLTVAYAC